MPAMSIGRIIAVVVLVLAVVALFGGVAIPVMLLVGALALAIVLG